MNSTYYSITGKQGSGKTGFLSLLVEKAILGGVEVGGFLQKRVDILSGIATAYDLTRARTDECVRVATRQSDRKFVFEEDAFRTSLAWVKEDILAARLIVIDELGFLECSGEGHAAVLPLLHASPRAVCCFSLRKDRAEEWYKKLLIPQSQRLDLDAEEANRDEFADEILSRARIVTPSTPPQAGGNRIRVRSEGRR